MSRVLKSCYIISIVLVLSIGASVNAETFAIGTTRNKIYLWDAIENKVLSTLSGHTAAVNVLKRLNETHIVSGGADNTIRVWDVSSSADTITPACTLSFHKDWVQDILITQNGTIVSASDDGTIKFLDPSNCKLVETIVVGQYVLSIKLIKNETYLVAGCSDAMIRVYNLTKNELEFSIKSESETSQIRRVDFLEESDYLISGDTDGRINIHNIANTTNVTLVKSIKDFFSSNLLSLKVIKWKAENYVMSSDSRGIVRIWSLKDEFQLKFTLQSESNQSLCVDTDLDNSDRLIGVSFDMLLNVWQLSEEHKMVNSLKINLKQIESGHVGLFTFLKLKSGFTLQRMSTIAKKDKDNGSKDSSTLNETQIEVIFGMENSSLVIWDLVANKSTAVLNGHDGPISVIKLIKNNAWLASGDNSTVIVWNLTNNTVKCRLNAHTTTISFLDELSSDILVSAAYDGLIKFWNLNECELTDSVYVGSPIYKAKRFDEKYLALANSDSTLKIFDLQREKILFNINIAHTVYSIETSTDYLITGLFGSRIEIWNKTDWRVAYSWQNSTMLAISMIVNKIDMVDHLTVIDQLGVIYIFSLRNLTLCRTLAGYSNIIKVQLFHLFNANETMYLSRSMSGLIKVWSVDKSNAKPLEYDLTGLISTESMTVSALVYFNRTQFELASSSSPKKEPEHPSSINILLSINTSQFRYGKIPAYRVNLPLDSKWINN